eukprot:g40141.t1
MERSHVAQLGEKRWDKRESLMQSASAGEARSQSRGLSGRPDSRRLVPAELLRTSSEGQTPTPSPSSTSPLRTLSEGQTPTPSTSFSSPAISRAISADLPTPVQLHRKAGATPFPQCCCCTGWVCWWCPAVSTGLGLGLALLAVLYGALDSTRSAQQLSASFFAHAHTHAVGWPGLLFFWALLLAICSPSSYMLYRTHDLETYGFFHLLGPPVSGLASQALFSKAGSSLAGLQAAYWGGPQKSTFNSQAPWFLLAFFYPLLFLLLAHLPYWRARPHAIDWLTLGKSWRMFHHSAVLVSVAKFTFSGVMEELGWSLFLFPQLLHVTGHYGYAAVLAGLTWGIWHVPMVLWGGYNYNLRPWWAALQLIYLTVVWAFTYMLFRVWSWSIWPVLLAHVSHNVLLEM